jgi:hypothetical protein
MCGSTRVMGTHRRGVDKQEQNLMAHLHTRLDSRPEADVCDACRKMF